jgi:tetratricopeptide (TPR) repeat protein
LRAADRLYLEVAEDYAIVANDSLVSVQVKDTAGSGTITINSQDVRDALDNFLDLVERNPDTQVTLRFLTTSLIGIEREVAHRINGEAVLHYWSKAARNAEIKPLRDAILRAGISDRLNTFIQARTDEELRRDLLKKITWDCGEPGLIDVKQELSSALVAYASDRLRLLPTDSEPLAAAVLDAVLTTVLCSEPAARYLDAGSLLKLCEQAGRTSLPNSLVESLIARGVAQGQNQPPELAISIVENLEDLPMPSGALPREDMVKSVIDVLNQFSVAILSAGTGMGKSVLARLSASAYGGIWATVDLRNAPLQECEYRLSRTQGEAATKSFAGVILDDLNDINHPQVAASLSRFLRALKRNNTACIVTCYKELPSGSLDKLGLDPGSSMRVPALSPSEVASLVQTAGGDPKMWATFVRYAGGDGHPQLVRAVLAGLKLRGWPLSDLAEPATTSIGTDVEEEREAIRQTLVGRMDEQARKYLYRTSLAVGRFKRQAALQLGEISPSIQSAGEYLDALIGPWIDNLGSGMLRVSPLVANAGESVLLPSEQISVHQMFATQLWADGKLDVRTVDDLFVHSLKGKSDKHLFRLAAALLKTRVEQIAVIAQWLPSLRFASLERPIVPNDPAKSFLFRLNQFVLCASIVGNSSHPINVWRALEAEILTFPPEFRARHRTMAIGKALCVSNLSSILPNWFSMLRELRIAVGKESRLAISHSETNGGLFISQAIHVGSVKAQLALFEALNGLDEGERDEYLGFTLQTRGGTAALVNGPWLGEVRSGTIDGLSASGAYQQMAGLTRSWGHPPLTILLLVAASIMLDEYAAEPQLALDMVKQAESEFENSLDLARARSKIFLRQHRHADVVSILHDTESRFGEFEPLERMFLRREAGISMAETGDWNGAAAQFSLAANDASLVENEISAALNLGLRADSALALYKANDVKSAVEVYREILKDLPEIDQDKSLQAVYCSRVIRHGLLWLHIQTIGAADEALINGEATVMVPGMCSNPTPPDDMHELPRSTQDAAWYLFLTLEAEVVGPTNALRQLEKRLGGKTAPTFDLTFRSYVINKAIENVTADGFAEQMHRWLDFVAYSFHQEIQPGQQLSSTPSFTTVPRISAELLQTDRHTQLVRSAIFSFGVSAAVSGSKSGLSALRKNFDNHEDLRHCTSLIDQMLAPKPDDQYFFITNSINTLLTRDELFATQLFEATLRFLFAVTESQFRKSIEAPVIRWTQRNWRKQVQSKLAFNNTNYVIPQIQAALEVPGLAGVAAVILAAESGLNVKLHEQLRDTCRKIVKGIP